MDAIVKMLAEAPEEQRRAMVRQRMDMFLSMPEENRVQGMRGMLLSISKLSPDAKERFIKTRTEVIANYPDAERKQLLQSRMKAGMGLPKEVDSGDMQMLERVLPGLPENLRSNFMKTKEDLMKAMGGAAPMGGMATGDIATGGPPSHHGRPMEVHGVLRKRYVCSQCGAEAPFER
jgi:hypothetical protein